MSISFLQFFHVWENCIKFDYLTDGTVRVSADRNNHFEIQEKKNTFIKHRNKGRCEEFQKPINSRTSSARCLIDPPLDLYRSVLFYEVVNQKAHTICWNDLHCLFQGGFFQS